MGTPVTEVERPDLVSGQTIGPTLAVVLGGGAARGLAHIGVLEVLEAEGIHPAYLAGTSIGGLVAALAAQGTAAGRILELARGFRFPRRYLPGRVLDFEEIFPTAVPLLSGLSFDHLRVPLALSAVDLQKGEEVVLHTGALLPAVRATCAVPGVLPPEPLEGRFLVDGGVMNVLPVDLAWAWAPDFIIAVNVLASPRRGMRLDSRYARAALRMGRWLPNPVTAHVAFDVVMRAFEIALERQRALAMGMASPEVLIDLELGDVSYGDFHRLAEVVEAGRRAARAALPQLAATLASPPGSCPLSAGDLTLHVDPVCRMIISPSRARARVEHDGVIYYFCSLNCSESFERDGARFLRAAPQP